MATSAPLELYQGPLPIRSFAFTGPAAVLRYAFQVREPAPTAAARVWHFMSAPARPPRLPPSPAGTLVTKKLIVPPPPSPGAAPPSVPAGPSALAPASGPPDPPLPPEPPLPL